MCAFANASTPVHFGHPHSTWYKICITRGGFIVSLSDLKLMRLPPLSSSSSSRQQHSDNSHSILYSLSLMMPICSVRTVFCI